MNVILIVVDCLRSDHLGINGYKRDTTPNIDGLAKNGVIFPNCMATIPRTTPSVASILTGLYPHSHGIRELYTDRLKPSVSTLQEILKSHGYKTSGHSIDIRNSGLEKGFDSFNPLSWKIINKIRRSMIKAVKWKHKEGTGKALTNFAVKKINEAKGKNFFLYLHYVDAHWPYDVEHPYSKMFDKEYTGEHIFMNLKKIRRSDLIFRNNLSQKEITHAISHYDGALRYIDFQIGRIISHLEKKKLIDETLIIVTSDHGESLGEHNIYFSHGDYAYDAELKVPLIFSKKILPDSRYDFQVQSTDIMPTILDILKMPLIDKIDGKSLVKCAEKSEWRKLSYAEGGISYFKDNSRHYIDGIKGKWRMIRSNEWKLICIPHPENSIFELYNIKEDPDETKNMIDAEKEKADALKAGLQAWMRNEKSDVNEPDLT